MLSDKYRSIPTCGPTVSAHLLSRAEDQLGVILEMNRHPEKFQDSWLYWSLSAGLLVEYSTKGMLAAISPDMLMLETAARGGKVLCSTDINDWAGIKTANISAVLSQLADMGAISNLTKKSGMSVLHVRNDAAHMGLMPQLSTLTESAMAFLCYLARDFNETIYSLYGTDVSEALTSFQRSSEGYVQDLMESSERNWQDACRTYKSEIQDYVKKREENFSFDWMILGTVECPTCHNEGVYLETIFDVEYEYEGPGESPSEYVIWEDEFTCPVCNLGLSGNQIQIAHEIQKIPDDAPLYKLWSSR